MDPHGQQTNAARPGVSGRLRDSWENEPADDNGRSPAEAFKDVGTRFAELKEYASYYVAAKADGIKTSFRNLGLYAVLGIVGLMAGGAVVVTAAVLLLTGIAGAISAIFRSDLTPPDRTWIG